MRDLTIEDYDRLVRKVYHAGLNPYYWQDVIDDTARVAGGVHLTMHAHDHRLDVSVGEVTSGFSPESLTAYDGHFGKMNVWMPFVAGLQLGRVANAEEYVPREQLRRTEFYNDWVRPEGIDVGTGLVLRRDSERMLVLSGHMRPQDEDRLLRPLMRLLELLGPHISISLDLLRRMAGQPFRPECHDALEAIPSGVYLVDRHERLVHANSAGHSLGVAGKLVALGRQCQLAFVDPAAQLAFQQTIFAIATQDHARMSRSFSASAGVNGPRATVIVAPFRTAPEAPLALLRSVLDDTPVAMVVVTLPSPHEQDLRRRLQPFGLTAAELQLAEALCAGASLQDFAESRQVSIHTVRNQLRSVTSKAGVSRQSQFVALVARLGAPLT